MSFKEFSSHLNERLIQSCKKNDSEDVNFCLQQGADVNKTSLCKFFEDDDDYLEEFTPLMIASHHGHHKIVKILLGIDGIDILFKDSFGCTALHLCAASGSKECLEEFAKIEATDWNCVNFRGQTPLFSAWISNADCVKFILSQPSVNPNIQDEDSDTPILLCLKEMDRDMIEGFNSHLDNLDFPMPMDYDLGEMEEISHLEMMRTFKILLECPRIELDSAIAWARAAELESSSWAQPWRTEIVRVLESRAVNVKKRKHDVGFDNTPEEKRREKDS